MGLFSKKEEPQYYSLDRILDLDASYNMIFGERSNGKTYAVLKYALEQYFEDGGEIGIIRRWQEDIKATRAQAMFAALVANNEVFKISKGEYTGIHYFSGRFYLCNYSDSDGKPVYNKETDLLGYVFALSDTEHNKSISFPNIKTILFDEFLTRGAYLPDEFVLFMNSVSTIVRQRTDVTIFMLGNTVNKYAPYFSEMGLNHVSQMEQGTIDIYTYGSGDAQLRVAVEYCGSMKNKKDNNFYFAFDNPKLEMITGGAWELAIYPHLPVKYRPKDILLTYFIKFQDRIFQCEIIEAEGELFTYIHNKTTPIQNEDEDIIYSLENSHKRNYCNNIFVPNTKVGIKIAEFFKHKKVFYQDNEVGDTVNNYLKICRGGSFI